MRAIHVARVSVRITLSILNSDKSYPSGLTGDMDIPARVGARKGFGYTGLAHGEGEGPAYPCDGSPGEDVIRGGHALQAIQRAEDATATPVEDVGVDHGGIHVGVAEQLLNGADVVALLQEVSGEGVAQRVAGGRLGDAGRAHRGPE